MRILPALFVLVLVGCTSIPHKPQAPLFGLQEKGRALRVMTFNIQRANRGVDGVVEAIRLANPDLVALQEVDVGTRRSRFADQAADLARLAGFEHHAFFPAMERDEGRYGVALLSHYPILHTQHASLPNVSGVEPRTVGRAFVQVRGAVLSVYVTHLAHMPMFASLRTAQMRRILGLIAEDPRPKILMGDLNDGAGSAVVSLATRNLRDVFALKGQGPQGTFPMPLKVMADPRFDYVLASRELTPQWSYVLKCAASDHYPVVAEVLLPSGAQPRDVDPGATRMAAK
jgi:endonuclease/exonuclease/phosphatase family metal-dependent hydrolase